MAAPSPPMILSHCKQYYHLSVDGDDKVITITKFSADVYGNPYSLLWIKQDKH